MPYGNLLADVVQSSTAGTPPQFNDGNGTQTGTLCRAWVNFNGVTTASIRASFNVSSVTRSGAGTYTVNFTNAMVDTNYAYTFGNSESGTSSQARFAYGYPTSTSQMAVYCGAYVGGVSILDGTWMCLSVFR